MNAKAGSTAGSTARAVRRKPATTVDPDDAPMFSADDDEETPEPKPKKKRLSSVVAENPNASIETRGSGEGLVRFIINYVKTKTDPETGRRAIVWFRVPHTDRTGLSLAKLEAESIKLADDPEQPIGHLQAEYQGTVFHAFYNEEAGEEEKAEALSLLSHIVEDLKAAAVEKAREVAAIRERERRALEDYLNAEDQPVLLAEAAESTGLPVSKIRQVVNANDSLFSIASIGTTPYVLLRNKPSHSRGFAAIRSFRARG
jgi:hypothetical protein